MRVAAVQVDLWDSRGEKTSLTTDYGDLENVLLVIKQALEQSLDWNNVRIVFSHRRES